jgi:hypothetical protein
VSTCGRLPDSLFCAIRNAFGRDMDGRLSHYFFIAHGSVSTTTVRYDPKPEARNQKLETRDQISFPVTNVEVE